MPDITWSSAEYDHFQLIFWLKSRFNNTKYFLEMSEFLDIHRFNTGNILQRKKGDQQQAFFEQKSFYTYDGIALMTRALLRHYESFPGKKPEFLHLPMTVDLDRFEQPAQASIVQNLKKPYIAFIGVMNNQKDGVDILINAFAAIEKDFHKHHLYLFGPYNYDTPGHLKQIKALNLEEKIFWHGEVSRDEVPSILVHADVLTLPRPASKQAQGGFPTKLGEYLASSRPVCVTNVGEIPDYLQDGKSAFFAEPGSSESFASAMRRALSDQENAILVGANGRKVAEKHFNKDIQSKILCDFLQNLLHDDQQ
jgi:glycosyltransferase involved in cell wall biosynthesis